jgi:FkbM family methyltransferase
MLETTSAYGLDLLVPQGDLVIGASLRRHGEFARPEIELIADHLAAFEPSACYIDVGANIGAIALPLAARRPQSKVVALEAHRGLANLLAANALNNRLYNVEAINAAVGAHSGLVRFPDPCLAKQINYGVLGFHLSDRTTTEAVRMCTLDEIAPPETRFVKIDVEGFEPEVLKGARALIESRRAVWLLEASNASADLGAGTMTVMLEAGYRLFWFFAPFVTGNAMRNPPKVVGIDGDLNFIALPPGVDNLWDLPPIHDPTGLRPGSVRDFRYLYRYGMYDVTRAS